MMRRRKASRPRLVLSGQPERTQRYWRVILCAGLIFGGFGCSRREPAVVMMVSFDGTLAPTKGATGPEVAFEPDFAGYLTRKSLRVHTGEIATYNIAENLNEGALQFWFKQGFTLSGAPIHLLRLSAGPSDPEVDLTLRRNAMELAVRPTPHGTWKVFPGTRDSGAAGWWQMLVVAWKDSEVRLYANDRLLASAPIRASWLPKKFAVGLWFDENHEDGVTATIRDLSVLDQPVDEKWIRASIDSYPPGVPKLVYRLCDLTHWNGKPVQDDQAQGGVAWTPDTLLAGAEKIRLPSSGAYELTFRLKASTDIDSGGIRADVQIRDGQGRAKTLASRENAEDEIQKKPTYQSFTLRFDAAAGAVVDYNLHCLFSGKYSLLLDTATLRSARGDWGDTRRVEDLKHTMGIWRADPDAAAGRAWSNQNALNIGPYACIGQPGRYRAAWRIKLSNSVPANTPLVLLKVFSHDGALGRSRRGNKDYASLMLSSGDFPQRNTWQNKSLDFSYDGSDMMEFIAHAKLLEPGSIVIDTITVEQLPASGKEKS